MKSIRGVGCIDKGVKSKSDIATPQNLLSGPIENTWKKTNALASEKKPARPKNHFEPPRPPPEN